jgi:pimeloyl-ACP methyl ester carboxylesterase
MKRCPECRRDYFDDTLLYCLDDGTPLLEGPASSDPGSTPILPDDQQATLIYSDRGGLQSSETFPDHENSELAVAYCTTSDGYKIAYSVTGKGPVIVRVLGHFTHLTKEWEWPELGHFWELLADHFTVVRYDGRGIGLSQPFAEEFTEESRLADLTAVINAVSAESVSLLAISEGGWTAAMYALRDPERVRELILYGSYLRGASVRPGYDPEEDSAIETLILKGWGRDTSAIRQFLTSRFFREGADPKAIQHFNELQRISADADTAVRYHRSLHKRGDATELFRKVSVPALVIHSQEDMAVSADEGRLLASTIPDAHLVLLPSYSHYFPTDSELAKRVSEAVTRFSIKGR